MGTLTKKSGDGVKDIRFTDTAMTVELLDGRAITVPLAWYPRLRLANAEQRNHWQPIGRGQGIHWPDIDEDLSIEGLLQGRRSPECPDSPPLW